MFTPLESRSRPAGRRPFAQAAVSVTVHLALLALAVRATAGAAAGTRVRALDTIPIYLPPAPRPADPAPEPAGPVSELPAGPTFTTVIPPLDVPTSIPPVQLGEPFDPSRYTGIGREVDRAVPTPGGSAGPGRAAAYLAAEVDVPVARLAGPEPRYPAALRAGGLEGRVLVEFVVDTLGRVEPGSWQVLHSAHGLFAESAVETVLASRFRPARVKGRPVRQLVRLPVTFTLSP